MAQNSTSIAQKIVTEIANRLKETTHSEAAQTVNNAEQQAALKQHAEHFAKHHFANSTQNVSEKLLTEEAIREHVIQEHDTTNHQKIIAEHLPQNSIMMATSENYNIEQLGQQTASDFQPNFSQAKNNTPQNTAVPENDNEAFEKNNASLYVRFHPEYDPIDYQSLQTKSYAPSGSVTDAFAGISSSDESNNSGTSSSSSSSFLHSNNAMSNAINTINNDSSTSNSGDHGGDVKPGGNDNNNKAHPLVPLEGKLLINEIGLQCSTETSQTIGAQQFHVDAGQSYIEVKNIYSGDVIPGYAIEQLAFEIANGNGQKQTIKLDTMSGDSDAHHLGTNETLVIFSNGTWAIYNADGEIRDQNSFGAYSTPNWNVGNSTSDALGVNFIQLATDESSNQYTYYLDQFLANNVDTRLFDYQNDGWDGAEMRGIADTNNSSSLCFASLLAHNNPDLMTDPATFHDQYRDLVGDQDHTLQLLGLTKPGQESNTNQTDDALHVFSREFSPSDQQGAIDNNTEQNWTSNNHATPGQWNNDAHDINPQDPNDDLNPNQNTNHNTALAGQTIIDDSLDGNTSDNNTISGGRGDDYLYGDDGNDVLKGDDNNDLLFGGNGNDQLYGDSGADLLVDLSGQDLFEGDGGDDILIANAALFNLSSSDAEGDLLIGDTVADWRSYNDATVGSDVIYAGETSDIIFGDTLLIDDLQKYQSDPFGYVQQYFSTDNVSEKSALVEAQHHLGKNDWISAGAGNDVVFGQGGDDYIDGSDGDDIIFGGDGNDTILGGSGTNQLFGNDGNDTIFSQGTDSIKGGQGDDQIFLHTIDSDGRSTLYYDDLLDGNDTVDGFRNGDKPNDQINLDALFDALGIADNERADKVLFKQLDPNTVQLTIDGLDNFSITFTNSENNDAKSFTVGSGFSDDILVSTAST